MFQSSNSASIIFIFIRQFSKTYEIHDEEYLKYIKTILKTKNPRAGDLTLY